MNRRRAFVTAVVAFATIAIASVAPRASADGAGQGSKSCIRFWPEVRYGALAYNHVVHVEDACDGAAECVVSSDSNPEPQKVHVPAHEQIEVVVFVGSPARTFTPRVACAIAK